jgi:hypothetical protein
LFFFPLHNMTNFNQTEMLYHQINNQSGSSSNNNNNNKNKGKKSNDKSLNTNTNASTTKKTNVKCGQQPANVKSQHFTQFKFQMIFIILFCCLFTCCIKYANTQETNYFYADGKQFSFALFVF